MTGQAGGPAPPAQQPHRPRRLDLDPALEARAARAAAALTGEPATFRATVSLAVERELERVVHHLIEAGLTSRPGARPRPREMNDGTWERLGEAAERVAVGRVELVRCCLERLARGGDK